MLIELAHYTFLFALTVIGLQTLLLFPTLWSGGSAVAIRIGFRGTVFTTFLLFLIFLIFMHAFVVHDFSLAVVFENFDSATHGLYALPAFCASREGYLFTFTFLTAVFLSVCFSKKDLATYRERGRYLFAAGLLILFLLILILSTANPFVRIDDPPFEGVGFLKEWRPPYKILSVLTSFSACGLLTASFIKTVCMYSKGRRFVLPALQTGLIVITLLTAGTGIELMTGFTTAADGKLWQWTPSDTLLLAVLMLTAGQLVLLTLCAFSKAFTDWVVLSAFFNVVFAYAGIFASEYRLFAAADSGVYFPNPVAALCALTGIGCFLVFLCSVIIRNKIPENGFPLVSKESLAGLAAASLIAAGFSTGVLSLFPSLFMFMPTLPLRLMPALIKKTFIISAVLSGLFLLAAFKLKRPAAAGPSGIHIPTSVRETLAFLKSVPAFKYGILFCAAGILVFSVSLSIAVLNKTETESVIALNGEKEPSFPCSVERLAERSETASTQYRIVCPEYFQPLSGDATFQRQEKELDSAFLRTSFYSIDLLRLKQTDENAIKAVTVRYPALQSAGTGIFLICAGFMFLLFAAGKEIPL